MVFLRKFGAWVAIGLTMSAPALACLNRADLTPAEQECCKQMAHHCANTTMPASHSCCTPTVRDGNSVALARTSGFQHVPVLNCETHLFDLSLTVPQRSSPSVVIPTSESPPSSISVLRI
jgi:hypothetical protein